MTSTVTVPDDGLVVVLKQDCPTCRLVAPVLGELGATVYSQDDPAFPAGVAAHDDTDLDASVALGIDVVPTLLRREHGVETQRAEGWDRARWRELSGVADLGADLPEW